MSTFSSAIDELVLYSVVDFVVVDLISVNWQVKELWDAGAICTSYAKTSTIPSKVS